MNFHLKHLSNMLPIGYEHTLNRFMEKKEIALIIWLEKGALAIKRIFSLVDMITKPKFSNCPNVFKIGLFR